MCRRREPAPQSCSLPSTHVLGRTYMHLIHVRGLLFGRKFMTWLFESLLKKEEVLDLRWLSGCQDFSTSLYKIKLWRLGKRRAGSPGCLRSRDRAVTSLQAGRGAYTTSTVTGLLLEIFNSGAGAHQGLIFQLPKRQFSRQMNLSTVGMKMFPK